MTEKRSRRRGKGSLQSYQTKAGVRWRFQIWVPVDHEKPELGDKKHSRAGFMTSNDADDAMQDALKKRRAQEAFHKSVPTVSEYATQWLESLRLEASTVDSYRRLIRNHIAPYFETLPIDKLTPTRIARHYRDLEKHGRKDARGLGQGLSANTVNKVHIALGALLEAALDDGLISSNPAKKKRTVNAPTGRDIRAAKPDIQTWTAAQLHAFLRWDRDVHEDELFTLWRVIAFTGLRRSEALALRWEDVHQKTAKLSLRRAVNIADRQHTKKTKTGSARSLELDAETLQALKSLKALRGSISLDLARPEAYIFAGLDGGLRNPDKVSKRWGTLMKYATGAIPGLPRITLKELRHTHATVLLELGEHPKIVQERLGHSTIATTMNIYSHVTPTMQRSAIDRLAKHVDG
ncbi:tyrosine recombinase XerC [Leucobacter sp. G161]|uniref:site-specific integrase n=1 Tax=Leucobacter sp. G161 TaxID=663704 RepID=UPI00073AFA68|nr:site-specific integrase [Leucobacter sp. G161]KUF06777.1 hypothetical protein AUL38_10995 [Leucobacter sp. G161]